MMKAGVLPLSLLLVAAKLPWATSHTWMFSKGIIIQAGTYKSCPEPWRDDTYACIHLRINPLPAIQCLGHCSVYMFVSVPLSCSILIRTNINEQEKLFKHSPFHIYICDVFLSRTSLDAGKCRDSEPEHHGTPLAAQQAYVWESTDGVPCACPSLSLEYRELLK